MTAKVTSMDLAMEVQERTELADATPTVPAAPSLEAIIDLICLDARRDSMQFALRSDVGIDGE